MLVCQIVVESTEVLVNLKTNISNRRDNAGSVPEFCVVVDYLDPEVDGSRRIYMHQHIVCILFEGVRCVVLALK